MTDRVAPYCPNRVHDLCWHPFEENDLVPKNCLSRPNDLFQV